MLQAGFARGDISVYITAEELDKMFARAVSVRRELHVCPELGLI